MNNQEKKPPFFSSRKRNFLIFNIPAYAILIIFTVIPIIYSFYVSLQRYDLTRPPIEFAGFNNYIYLFNSELFWASLRNTIVYTFSSLIILFLLSFSLALLLNESIRGTGKLRGLIVVPWAIPPIITGIIWAWIFDARYGIMNYILDSLGRAPILWLSNPTFAMFSVVIARSWHEITFGTLMLLAGLQSIPIALYEAAKVDGAGMLDKFKLITLPLIRSQIAIVLIFETMWCLREFATIYAMTYGGPINATTVLGWFAYKLAFLQYDFGRGAAVAFILGVLTMILAAVYIKFIYRRVEY